MTSTIMMLFAFPVFLLSIKESVTQRPNAGYQEFNFLFKLLVLSMELDGSKHVKIYLMDVLLKAMKLMSFNIRVENCMGFDMIWNDF